MTKWKFYRHVTLSFAKLKHTDATFFKFLICFFPLRKYNEFDWFMRRAENEKVIFLTCQKASKAVQLNWFLFYNFAEPLRTLFVKSKKCNNTNKILDFVESCCWFAKQPMHRLARELGQISHLSNLKIKQRSFLRIWRLDSSPLESSKVLGHYVWNFPIQHQATKNNRSGRLWFLRTVSPFKVM